MFYEALIELNNFLLNEEIAWNNLENSLILTEASIFLNEEDKIAEKTESIVKKFGLWLKGLFDKTMDFFANFLNNIGQVCKGIANALKNNSIREAIEKNKDWKKISITIPDTRQITNKLISNSIDLKTSKGIRVLEEALSNVPMIQLQKIIKNTNTLVNLINSTNKSKEYILKLRNIIKQEIKQSEDDLKTFKYNNETLQQINKEIAEKKSILMRLVKISSKFVNIVRIQYYSIFKFIKGIGRNIEIKSKYVEKERDTGKAKNFNK